MVNKQPPFRYPTAAYAQKIQGNTTLRIFIDGEPFWGFDRFDQLEAFLKNGKI